MSASMSPVYFYLLLSLLLVLHRFVSAERSGFSIKIIHHNSMETLYPGNLIFEVRLKRHFQQSKIDSAQGDNATKTVHLDVLHSPVTFMRSLYLARFGIGTFPPSTPGRPSYKFEYLILDTGSASTWIQCQGCHPNCFNQNSPLYPWNLSGTYRELTCDRHPSCPPGHCHGGKCIYQNDYLGGCHSKGYLATEKFTFSSDNGPPEIIPNIVFGCGREQRGFPEGATDMTGVLGLGRGGPKSFLNQIFAHNIERKFSYCLQDAASDPSIITYLRFGSNARFPPRAEIFTNDLYYGIDSDSGYYLKLDDISIAGHRLHFRAGSFNNRQNLSLPGCSLDTGTKLTRMRPSIYSRISNIVMKHFQHYNLTKTEVHGMGLCHIHQPGFNHYPNMVYHFHENKNFEVVPNALFTTSHNVFCLTILPFTFERDAVIIGNYHQANHRFVYNFQSHKVSFAKEHCGSGARTQSS